MHLRLAIFLAILVRLDQVWVRQSYRYWSSKADHWNRPFASQVPGLNQGPTSSPSTLSTQRSLALAISCLTSGL